MQADPPPFLKVPLCSHTTRMQPMCGQNKMNLSRAHSKYWYMVLPFQRAHGDPLAWEAFVLIFLGISAPVCFFTCDVRCLHYACPHVLLISYMISMLSLTAPPYHWPKYVRRQLHLAPRGRLAKIRLMRKPLWKKKKKKKCSQATILLSPASLLLFRKEAPSFMQSLALDSRALTAPSTIATSWNRGVKDCPSRTWKVVTAQFAMAQQWGNAVELPKVAERSVDFIAFDYVFPTLVVPIHDAKEMATVSKNISKCPPVPDLAVATLLCFA